MNHLQKTHQPIIHRPLHIDYNKSQTKVNPSHLLQNENRSQMYISVPNHQQQLSVKSNNREVLVSNKKLELNSFEEDQSKSSGLNNNLYQLMKEQIDIACANYRQKMNILIKSQAQEIQKLSYLIINHTHIINKQAQIIKKLQGNDMAQTKIEAYSTQHKDYSRVSSKSPAKLSLTQKKFVSRPNISPLKDPKSQLQSKINHLNLKLNELSSQLCQTSSKNQTLLLKVSSLQKQYQKNLIQRIKLIKQKFDLAHYQTQSKIIILQNSIKTNSSQRQEIYYRLSSMKEQVESIKEEIQNITNRQYVYDSYPLNILKDQIKQIMSKLDQFAKTKEPTSNPNNSHLHSSQSLNYSQRFTQQAPLYEQSLNRSQLSSLSHYAPKYIKAVQEERVKRSNDWYSEENEQSFNESDNDDDQFFHPVVRSEILIDTETKSQRLQRIILRQNARRPVKVEVDQTGYIKYHTTGMYILDQNGDGFDLSPSELKALKDRGIITI